ncbi:MAG: tRNA (adenosine(37)-N6)-threonylcarbamoyltransferase complex ATPase subunit type 1 TsaE [Christensenella sp.]
MPLFITKSERKTESLGASLAAVLPNGCFIAFTGGLGVGKTAF